MAQSIQKLKNVDIEVFIIFEKICFKNCIVLEHFTSIIVKCLSKGNICNRVTWGALFSSFVTKSNHTYENNKVYYTISNLFQLKLSWQFNFIPSYPLRRPHIQHLLSISYIVCSIEVLKCKKVLQLNLECSLTHFQIVHFIFSLGQ